MWLKFNYFFVRCILDIFIVFVIKLDILWCESDLRVDVVETTILLIFSHLRENIQIKTDTCEHENELLYHFVTNYTNMQIRMRIQVQQLNTRTLRLNIRLYWCVFIPLHYHRSPFPLLSYIWPGKPFVGQPCVVVWWFPHLQW